MARTITEIKRHLDGRVQEFRCEAVHVEPNVAVIEAILDEPLGPYDAGTRSMGFFWRRRPYNLFRMHTPEGDLIADRFDVVADVRIETDRIEYLDLLLDVVVSATGDLAVEDEDEVRAAAEEGLLEPRHLEAIERALTTITRDHRRIVREALDALPT